MKRGSAFWPMSSLVVAIYSAFSIAIAIAQALGPATPINQVLTLAGAVVLGLVGVSGALFKLSDWFARHIEIGEEEPASSDAAQPALVGDPQHARGCCPRRKHGVHGDWRRAVSPGVAGVDAATPLRTWRHSLV